jgi:hypothetical protein
VVDVFVVDFVLVLVVDVFVVDFVLVVYFIVVVRYVVNVVTEVVSRSIPELVNINIEPNSIVIGSVF